MSDRSSSVSSWMGLGSVDISECRRESRDKGHLLILLMLFCLCVGWCP